MADNSIPENIPQDHEESPNNQTTSSKAANYIKEQIMPTNGQRFIEGSMEVVGCFITGMLGFWLSEAGFHILAFLCYALTVGCGVGLLTLILRKAGVRYAWKIFWLLMICNAVFLLYSTRKVYLFEHMTPQEKLFSFFTTSLFYSPQRNMGKGVSH